MAIFDIPKFVLYALVVSVVSITSTIAAEEPDGAWKPTPIGTKVTYNIGMSWEVTAVDGGKIYRKGNRGPDVTGVTWYNYRGLFESINYSDGGELDFDTNSIDKLFPLKVGNKTTVSYSLPGWRGKTAYKVVAYKEVKTLLGIRPVFVIAYVDSGDGNYRAKGWNHYDPELGFWHRGVYTILSGTGGELKMWITDLELPE